MEQFLSFITSLLASEEFSIYLMAWGFLAVALTIALAVRRIMQNVAAIEEAKRQHRLEERLGEKKARAERAEAERTLEALQNSTANKDGPRTARDFTPYGYSDRAA